MHLYTDNFTHADRLQNEQSRTAAAIPMVMLPATQLQKDVPPETTCDAYTPRVISCDVIIRHLSDGVENTQHAPRLHCIVSTSHENGRDVDAWRLSLWLSLLSFVAL